MHIQFSTFLDGAEWTHTNPALGAIRTGSVGLQSHLEGRLGLAPNSVPQSDRILEMQRILIMLDTPDAYFHESLQADPFATARHLLQRRDELVYAGWDGGALTEGGRRLDCLASIEKQAVGALHGPADNLLLVRNRLISWKSKLTKAQQAGPGIKGLRLTAIELCQDRSYYHPVWQSILDLLEQIGVSIHERALPDAQHEDRNSGYGKVEEKKAAEARTQPRAKSTAKAANVGLPGSGVTNLKQLQARFAGEEASRAGSKKSVGKLHPQEQKKENEAAGADLLALNEDDQSLLRISGHDEWSLAIHLAAYLAADPERNRDLAIIAANSEVLDAALAEFGLPPIGTGNVGATSVAEVMEIWLQLIWRARDKSLILAFLAHPLCPMSGSIRWPLISALADSDPNKSADWSQATELRTFLDEASLQSSTESQQMIAQRLDWLHMQCRSRVHLNPGFALLLETCKKLKTMVERQPVEGWAQLRRYIRTVAPSGSSRIAGAGPWRIVDHPGQLTDPCTTLIWWGFQDETLSSLYWSPEERKALESAGCSLESLEPARREREAARNAIRLTAANVLFYDTQTSAGESAFVHPFWDEIAAAFGAKQVGRLIRSPERAEDSKLAGRTITTIEDSVLEAPAPVDQIAVTALEPRSHFSYSSMTALLGCPAKYGFHYLLGLKSSPAVPDPKEHNILGSLAHLIVDRLIQTDPAISEAKAIAGAQKLFDETLPSALPNLLLPERNAERLVLRERMSRAVGHLMRTMQEQGLQFLESEQAINRTWKGAGGEEIPITGRIDLTLRDSGGRSAAVDLKWQNSSRRRRTEIEEGEALQLATYAWLLSEENEEPGAAYYMLKQNELLAASGMQSLQTVHAPEIGSTLNEIWQRATNSLEQSIEDLKKGHLPVSGVIQERESRDRGHTLAKVQKNLKEELRNRGEMYVSPECQYCSYGNLCGQNGGFDERY